MEFKEKNKIVQELASQDFIPKDRDLLESNFPGHELLSCCSIASRQATLDNEILYVLLDKLTPEEIINNRYGVRPNKKPDGSCSSSPGESNENPDSSKKKSQKKRSTQKSTGRICRTRTSKKQS